MMNYQGQIPTLFIRRDFNAVLLCCARPCERIDSVRVTPVRPLDLIPELFQKTLSGERAAAFSRRAIALILASQLKHPFRDLHPDCGRQANETLNKSLDRIR
jgi:hypothetical protein